MDLHEWLCRQKIKDSSFTEIGFSKKLGVTKNHFCKIKKGRERPSYELAKKIESLTDGNVNSWEIMSLKPLEKDNE